LVNFAPQLPGSDSVEVAVTAAGATGDDGHLTFGACPAASPSGVSGPGTTIPERPGRPRLWFSGGAG